MGICRTLCSVLNNANYSLVDLNRIGKVRDRCTCPNKYNASLPLFCKKGNATLAKGVANYTAYFSPTKTGKWHCLKKGLELTLTQKNSV